jgi:hypothetical protein
VSANVLGVIVAIVVANAGTTLGIVYFLVARIDRRLEKLEQGQTDIKVAQAQFAQRLDDHIESHPGPTERLVRS